MISPKKDFQGVPSLCLAMPAQCSVATRGGGIILITKLMFHQVQQFSIGFKCGELPIKSININHLVTAIFVWLYGRELCHACIHSPKQSGRLSSNNLKFTHSF